MPLQKIVTVVIPTQNRFPFFKQSLQSVLEQKFTDFQIIVKDSSKTEDVKNYCDQLNNTNIKYIRHASQSIIDSWNTCIELANSKYISIFHDDDIMLPGFIEKSVISLENYPTVGMSYTSANKVDINLNYISEWFARRPENNFMRGMDYLKFTIECGCCVTIAPTVILRKSACEHTGPFIQEFCFNSFDFNYWIRIASKYDVFFVPETLVNYRIHENQMSQDYWWSQNSKGRLATMFEIQKAIFMLCQKDEFSSYIQNKAWLLQKANEYNLLAAKFATKLLPGL